LGKVLDGGNGHGFSLGDHCGAVRRRHDYLYRHGDTLTDLGTLGGSWSRATAINDKGQVVGEAATTGDLASHAFLYSKGTMIDLTQVVFDLFLVENFMVSGISADQIIGGVIEMGTNMPLF
jgi:probable HAF family extracellular repeat protein